MVESLPDDSLGLLCGLRRDQRRRTSRLNLMHAEPIRDWTLMDLPRKRP